jgi:predicted NBD/HSP70 family sugar kinase
LAVVKIARPDDVRRQNRRHVLAAARRAGSLSRTELAARTGLSASTVSAITSALIGEGVLAERRDQDRSAEAERAGNRRGRPQVILDFSPEAATVAVVVLAINSLSVALVDYAGATIAEETRRVPTLPATGGELIAAVGDALESMVDARRDAGARLMHIAMGVQGVTDAAGTAMLWSPIVRSRDIAFGPALEKRFRVPVSVSNDCTMIAEALRWADPDHYGGSFAAVLLSHGIGMGLYLNGRAFKGVRSSAAEFGHMVHVPDGALCRCGKHGCIEAYAGDYAILRAAEAHDLNATPGSDVAASDITRLAKAARQGSEPARRAFREAGRAIGFGLGSLFSIIDPVPVALVGPGAMALDLCERDIRAAIGEATSWEDAPDIPLRAYFDEHPLIVQGCMMTSLLHLDAEVFAPGERSQRKAG